MSLRFRLLVAAALVVAVLAAIGLSLIHTVETSQLKQTDSQLMATVPIAVGIALNAQTAPDSPLAPPDRTIGLSNIYVALIVDGQRQTVASPQSTKGAAPEAPPAESLSASTFHPETVRSLVGAGRWRAALLQTPNETQVLVAIDLAAVDATAAQLREALLVAAAVVAVILLASGFWLERLGLRPIAEMTAVADAIVAGDRSRRVTTSPSGGEAGHLAQAINSMLDKQKAIEDQLRQFVADASHELRTPTSVISGFTQLWRQGDLRHGEELEDAMRRIGQESNRMRCLVDELMLLARLDEGAPLQTESVDVGELIRDVLTDSTSTHPSRRITALVADHVSVQGDPTALRRVFSNLVINALVHTPTTSPIVVRVHKAAGSAIVEIADSGPGMDPTDSAHAFDRFWRGQASRTRAGSGLGLSIVKAVVHAHAGQIHLDTSPERGTTFQVVLPVLSGTRHPSSPGYSDRRRVPSERAEVVTRTHHYGSPTGSERGLSH